MKKSNFLQFIKTEKIMKINNKNKYNCPTIFLIIKKFFLKKWVIDYNFYLNI